MTFNSVIFNTPNLAKIREFYEGVLGLPTGTFMKNGERVPDFSSTYVNYHLAGGLLCFEIDGPRLDLGTVVLNTPKFEELRTKLRGEVTGGNEHYFKLKDPDGRSLIIEPDPTKK